MEDESYWLKSDLDQAEADLDRLRERLADAEKVIDYYSDPHGERWLRMYLDGRWRNVFDVTGLAHSKARTYRSKYPEGK